MVLPMTDSSAFPAAAADLTLLADQLLADDAEAVNATERDQTTDWMIRSLWSSGHSHLETFTLIHEALPEPDRAGLSEDEYADRFVHVYPTEDDETAARAGFRARVAEWVEDGCSGRSLPGTVDQVARSLAGDQFDAARDTDYPDWRTVHMRAVYVDGATLHTVGQMWGLTRERARQILAAGAFTTRQLRVAQSREQRLRELVVEARDRKVAVAWSEGNTDDLIRVGAEVLGFKEPYLRHLLGRRVWLHPRASYRPQRVPDATLLAVLREWLSDRPAGDSPSEEFSTWAAEYGHVGHQTYTHRWGSWNAAVRAAGLAEHQPEDGRTRSRLFTDEDLWAAVVEYLSDPDNQPVFHAMDRWLQARPAMPSGARVRTGIGQWRDVRARATQVLDGTEPDREWAEDVSRPRDWEALRRTFDKSYLTVEDVERHVREFAATLPPGQPLTTNGWQEWATQGKGRPSVKTMREVTGLPWIEMVLGLGLPVASHVLQRKERYGSTAQRDRTRDALLASIREFAGEVEDRAVVTSTNYGRWALRHDRTRLHHAFAVFGTWDAAVRAALDGEGGGL